MSNKARLTYNGRSSCCFPVPLRSRFRLATPRIIHESHLKQAHVLVAPDGDDGVQRGRVEAVAAGRRQASHRPGVHLGLERRLHAEGAAVPSQMLQLPRSESDICKSSGMSRQSDVLPNHLPFEEQQTLTHLEELDVAILQAAEENAVGLAQVQHGDGLQTLRQEGIAVHHGAYEL